MVSTSQIKERLAMFLDKRIDVESLEDWLLQNTWNIHLSGSAAAEAITFAIEESLAEYSSRHLDDHEFRSEISRLVHRDNQVAVIRYAPVVAWQAVTSSPLVFAAASARP